MMDTASINANALPTLTDTAGVIITATNPWKIKKIPVINCKECEVVVCFSVTIKKPKDTSFKGNT